MTKLYKIFVVLCCLFAFHVQTQAQCISINQFGFSTSNAPGSYTITTCNFGDEFSSLTLNVTGSYTFASDNATDYLTLTDVGGVTVLASGPTPLLYNLTTAGNYELHIFASGPPTCMSDFNCRTTSYTIAAPPGSPTIITQPVNAGACAAGNVQFTCSATPTNCNYAWEEDQGSGFVPLVNGGVYSGVFTPTLQLTGVTGAMNGYYYRCVISNTVASLTTTAALLNVISNGSMPLLEDFNSSLTTPVGWINDPNFPWYVISNHGTGGTNGMTGNLFSTFSIYEEITTVKVGPATPSTAISFDYRIVNWSGYPSTATPLIDFANDSLNVYISTNCGTTYSLLGSVNAGNHVVSTNFFNKSFSLAPYAGNNMVFKFVGKKDPMGTGDYYIDVDNINIFNLVANDAGVNALVSPPAGQPCYSVSTPVTVTIKNFGSNTISNIPVTVVVSGAVNQTLTGTYTSTLATTATTNFTVGNLNMSAAGTYSFKAFTTFPSDGALGNDTLLPLVTRTVIATTPLPYTQNFNASTALPAGWTADPVDPFFVMNNHGTANSNGMTRNLFSNLDKAAADMLRLGPVTASTAISFDYRYVNWSGYPSTATPTVDLVGDSLYVLASTNCGQSFSTVGLITTANHSVATTAFTNKSYTLGALAGNDVIIRFLAVRQQSNTTSDYYIDIDNINLYNLTAIDGGVAAVLSPSTGGCYSASQPVAVSITNYGLGSLSNIPVSVVISGPNSQTLTGTFPGPLAVGASATFTVGNANMSAGGAYTFSSSTTLASDGNVNNDMNVSSFTVNPVVNIAGPSAVCLGNTATLTINGTSTSYTWSTGAQTSSLVISPTTNTVYSVIGSAATCTASGAFTVSVQNPTISATNVSACGNPATATLTANGFTPSVINWYASPTSTTSLGTGNTFTVSSATTTTYYAQASSTSTGSLFTTLAAGNGSSGNMFDIAPTANITIQSCNMHFGMAGVTTTVEVWYRPGSFVGFESSNTGWTMAHTTTVVTNGTGTMTPIPGTFAINVPAGQTYGLYITSVNGNPITNYTNGTGLSNLYTSNGDLALYEGKGGSYFGVINSPRVFNGALFYTKQGCTSTLTPVTFSVAAGANVTAVNSNTAICSGNTATLTAGGAANYTWSPGSLTGSVVVVSPSVATTYTVYGEDGACNGTATTTLGVNPSPTLNVSPTVFVPPGTVVTLTVSGANSYSWNPGGSNNNSILVAPVVSTTYTVTGTNSFGCVTTATTSIEMSGIGFNENNLDGSFMKVYPNPNYGVINITTDNGKYNFEVFDVAGKLVYSAMLNKVENTINIRELANGMYTYKISSVENNHAYKQGKLIKQ